MPAIDATLISKKNLFISFDQSRLFEYKFTAASVGAGSSGVFRFPLDFSGKINAVRVACLSTNYDMSIRNIDGTTTVDNTVDEIFKVIGINLSDIRSDANTIFDTETINLLDQINNPKSPSYQFNEDPSLPDVVGASDGAKNFIKRNDGLLFPVVESGGTAALKVSNAQNSANNRIFFILRYEADRLLLVKDQTNFPIISELNDTTAVIDIYRRTSRISELFVQITNNDTVNATGTISFVLQVGRF